MQKKWKMKDHNKTYRYAHVTASVRNVSRADSDVELQETISRLFASNYRGHQDTREWRKMDYVSNAKRAGVQLDLPTQLICSMQSSLLK